MSMRSLRSINPEFLTTLTMLVVLFGCILRLQANDISREIVPGDELTYQNAAYSLAQNATIVREPYRDLRAEGALIAPSAGLSPGYPLFLAILTATVGSDPQSVFLAQIFLSCFIIIVFWALLRELDIAPYAQLIGVLGVSLYPGLIANLDRMLSETLFTFIFICFVYAFVRAARTERLWHLFTAGALIGFAMQIKAQALPVVILCIGCLYLIERKDWKSLIRKVMPLMIGLILIWSPWWAYTIIFFNDFHLLPSSGDGAKIWGAVPYFMDMASTANKTLDDIETENIIASTSTYYKWRTFGMTQFMWGDWWDEKLRHPEFITRYLGALHLVVLIPTLILLPLLRNRLKILQMFVISLPIYMWIIHLNYHGLPRYVLPTVPFVFAALAMIISNPKEVTQLNQSTDQIIFHKVQNKIQTISKNIFSLFSIIFSVLLLYSVFLFSWSINAEMSQFYLRKHTSLSITDIKKQELIHSQKLLPHDMMFENVKHIGPAQDYVLKNHIDAPSIIKIHTPLLTFDTESSVITELKIELPLRSGFQNHMTVYWLTNRDTEYSERRVIGRFPINRFEKQQKIYIPDDVSDLLIVPAGLYKSQYQAKSITVNKYRIHSNSEQQKAIRKKQ